MNRAQVERIIKIIENRSDDESRERIKAIIDSSDANSWVPKVPIILTPLEMQELDKRPDPVIWRSADDGDLKGYVIGGDVGGKPILNLRALLHTAGRIGEPLVDQPIIVNR